MKRRYLLTIASIALLASGCTRTNSTDLANSAEAVAQVASNTSTVEVHRTASCGCCGLWVEHMQEAGFTVAETITEDLSEVKTEYGVPDELASCHTSIVDGYVVEGHIPAEDIARLLTEKPDVAGIAVPGMPIGSPGMEVGDEQEPYTVLSFQGETVNTFSEHP